MKLANLVGRLRPAKILVIGDLILDSYTVGKAGRISPEAPVAVVDVQGEEQRPGGAGNVLLNLLSLGAQTAAVGRVGGDWQGRLLIDALHREGVDTRMIVSQEGYRTAVKNRIVADNQQIVRVDREDLHPLSPHLERQIVESFPSLLSGVQAVAISDYGKGFLTPSLLQALIAAANRCGIPVIADPKGQDFEKYRGTTLIKPNLAEAFAAARLPRTAPLEEAAAIILQQTQARLLMVTRSEAGISLFDPQGERSDFPVQAKQVKDVTGAGDTVLAVLVHAIANRLTYQEAAQLCNIAAGIAIEQVGCARVGLSDLASRLFEQQAGHKVFDEEHLFVLQEVLKLKPFHLLLLPQADQLTPSLFRAIQNSAVDSEALLVFVEGARQCEPFVGMLASLREVGFILLHLESLRRLCLSVAPRAIYDFDFRSGQLRACKGLCCDPKGPLVE